MYTCKFHFLYPHQLLFHWSTSHPRLPTDLRSHLLNDIRSKRFLANKISCSQTFLQSVLWLSLQIPVNDLCCAPMDSILNNIRSLDLFHSPTDSDLWYYSLPIIKIKQALRHAIFRIFPGYIFEIPAEFPVIVVLRNMPEHLSLIAQLCFRNKTFPLSCWLSCLWG